MYDVHIDTVALHVLLFVLVRLLFGRANVVSRQVGSVKDGLKRADDF